MKNLILKFKNFIRKIFRKNKGLYYINGPETLPAPLSLDEEQKILDLLGTGGDAFAREKLIVHNCNLLITQEAC